LKQRKIVISVLLVAVAVSLFVVPSIVAAQFASGSGSQIEVRGIWSLPNFNATTLRNVANVSNIASYGSGPITGGIKGQTAAALLLKSENKAEVILFTGQIYCSCTVGGKSGDLWIAIVNAIDHNSSDPNGATTGELTIVGSQYGLAGTTGHGSFVTTTSSADMNYTMWITVG
jgi:hypothetical protein